MLDLLTGGPLSTRDIVDELDSSRSTVNRAVRELTDAGFVQRIDRGYATTFTGRLALDRYRAYRDESRAIIETDEVLEPLPVDCDLSVDVLVDAAVSVGSDPVPYRPLEQVNRAIEAADRYRAVLPTLADPRQLRHCYEHVVTDDCPGSLVVSDELAATLRDEFPRRVAEMTDSDAFELRAGEVFEYGLLLTDEERGPVVTVLVFGDDGVHGVVRNDTDAAVAWAREQFETARAAATPVTEQPAASDDVPDPDSRLPVALERAGFVRLDRDYFTEEAVADPTTAWTTGLELPEVHTGYAVRRTVETDGASESLGARLRRRLRDGDDCAVLGPPGAGKSTLCKCVACEWYEDDTGPVLYRERGSGGAFDDPDALLDALDSYPGQPLVVVEDAVRPTADAVFDAAARADDAAFLLDARVSEWHDPPGDPGEAVREEFVVETLPRLLGRDCERLADRFEATVDADIDVPVGRIRRRLRADADADADGPVPGEALLFTHRLVRLLGTDDGPTSLERETTDLLETLRRVGDEAVDVGVTVNLLNAAGVTVRPAYAHAVGPSDVVESALDALDGHVIFDRETDGPPRTTHEAWSEAFLRTLLDADDEAPERVGRCLTRLLGLGDDPERRAAVTRAVGDPDALPHAAADPEEWAATTARRVWTLAVERPAFARLLGRAGELTAAFPDAVDDATVTRCRLLTARGHLRAGSYDDAEAAFRSLKGEPSVETERLRGRCKTARHRGNFDEAEQFATAYREAADDSLTRAWADYEHGCVLLARGECRRADDRLSDALSTFRREDADAAVAACLGKLGMVADDRGDPDAAEGRYEEALDAYQSLGDRMGEAWTRYRIGVVANRRANTDTANELLRRSLNAARRLGDRRLEALALRNLGNVALARSEYDAAEERYEEALSLTRELGDRDGVAGNLGNLGVVAHRRGEFTAAAGYYRRALSVAEEIDDKARQARALRNLALVLERKGALAAAAERAEAALDVSESTGNTRLAVEAMLDLGTVRQRQGALDAAEETLGEARERARGFDDQIAADAEVRLGVVALRRGRLVAAKSWFESALETFEADGVDARVADCRRWLGTAARDAGELTEARDHARAAVDFYREADDETGLANCLALAGDVERRQGGDPEPMLGRALEIACQRSYSVAEFRALRGLGALALDRENPECARERFEDARAVAADSGEPHRKAEAELGLGRVALARANLNDARTHFSTAAETFRETGSVRRRLDALAALGEACRDDEELEVAARWLDEAVEAAEAAGFDDEAERLATRREALPPATEFTESDV